MMMLDDAMLEQVVGGRRPAEDLGQKMAPTEGDGGGGTWGGDPKRQQPGRSPFPDLFKDPKILIDGAQPVAPPPRPSYPTIHV